MADPKDLDEIARRQIEEYDYDMAGILNSFGMNLKKILKKRKMSDS